MAHLLGSTDEGETVGKKPFESYPSDRCESNCPLASAILSTSSESEGYEELVRRTLAALDRSELEPVLESKVWNLQHFVNITSLHRRHVTSRYAVRQNF